MLSIHACEMTFSMGHLSAGMGSNIFRMSGRQGLGLKLLIVGGHAETCEFELAQACAYAEYS
jgi:hypothetical protein